MDELIKWLHKVGEAVAKYVPAKEKDFWKLQQTIDIAIVNLRAREARVLDKEHLHSGVVYWLEQENVTQPWPIALHHIRNAHLLTGPEWEDYYGDVWKMDEYGMKWRCWTVMPTDEQRKGVRWDD